MAIKFLTQSIGQLSYATIDSRDAVLNSRIVTQSIYKFIDGFEANSLPLVCRSWKHLILEKKNQMFFVKNQVGFLHGSVRDFSSADYYLLGEHHGNEICKALYRELILGLGRHYFVIVLFEAIPSYLYGIPKLNECLIANVKHYTGIDYLDPLFENIKLLFSGWAPSDWINEANELEAFETETNKKISKQKVIHKDLSQEEFTATDERRIQIKKEKERCELICEILEAELYIQGETFIKDSFPKRTQIMIDTLNLLEETHIKVFVQGV